MWSKLVNTGIGAIAKQKMDANDCEYHNFDHILSMYSYLEKNKYDYNSTLDLAIMYHDVVYDDQPNKEDRSADFLKIVSEKWPINFEGFDIDGAMYLIYDTIDHRIGHSSNDLTRAIIRADLHQLAEGMTVFRNFTNIMTESTKLYGCSVDQFAAANEDFLKGLRSRVSYNFNSDSDYQSFWSDVIRGIDETIYLARMVSRKRT